MIFCPRRALLYMPATDWRKIEKATTLTADSICMDLEDGTALNRKSEGRETIIRALNELDFGDTEVLYRINAVGSGLEMDDIAAVLPHKPDGLVIPKVTCADDVQIVSNEISRILGENAVMPILAITETALGIVNLKEIAGADPRLSALIFGAEDLAGDIGAQRTPEAMEVFYARSAVVTHAAAFGLQAIDMLSADFKNMDALIAQAKEGAQLGYTGKQIIHPNQITPTQTAFSPTEEEITHAHRVVEAHNAHQAEGTGAFAMDGKMVDMPIVKAAERVLARAEIGKGK